MILRQATKSVSQYWGAGPRKSRAHSILEARPIFRVVKEGASSSGLHFFSNCM